jgi:hypothetical protein
MIDRVRIRCPVCGSFVPVVVVWAIGGDCPDCFTALCGTRGLHARPSPSYGQLAPVYEPSHSTRPVVTATRQQATMGG